MATVQIEKPLGPVAPIIPVSPFQPIVKKNNHLVKTMLQALDGLRTRYVCAICGQALMLSNMFAMDEIRRLMGNLTGSCPNCRHTLSFSPENTRFLYLST